MNFVITPEIFSLYPDLKVGLLMVKDANNTKHNAELTSLLRKEEENIRSSLDTETFKEHPKIASLQEAHRQFGNNPNKFPPSIQALTKRILKGGQLPDINPLVDIYNIISLRYIVPAGCEDLDICEGDIRLALADGDEHFRALGDEEDEPPKPGEVVYKDDVGVICRKMNWREGDRTKLTESTKNAVIVIEALPPVTEEELEDALNDLKDMVEKYCGGTCKKEVMSVSNPSVALK